jgi:hypothetical protein
MMSRSMTNRRIRIGCAPGQDGRTLNDEIAGTQESSVQGLLPTSHKERFMGWGTCRMVAFAFLRGAGNAEPPAAIREEANARAGQACNQSCMSWEESRHKVRNRA